MNETKTNNMMMKCINMFYKSFNTHDLPYGVEVTPVKFKCYAMKISISYKGVSDTTFLRYDLNNKSNEMVCKDIYTSCHAMVAHIDQEDPSSVPVTIEEILKPLEDLKEEQRKKAQRTNLIVHVLITLSIITFIILR